MSGLAGGADVFDLTESVADLHRENNTIPGEVFMGLAADALEIANVTRVDVSAFIRQWSPVGHQGQEGLLGS